jgi:hypothetical protein
MLSFVARTHQVRSALLRGTSGDRFAKEVMPAFHPAKIAAGAE